MLEVLVQNPYKNPSCPRIVLSLSSLIDCSWRILYWPPLC